MSDQTLSELTLAQRTLIDNGTVVLDGWDAKGLPVVRFVDLDESPVRFVDLDESPPIALGATGNPLTPTDPVIWLGDTPLTVYEGRPDTQEEADPTNDETGCDFNDCLLDESADEPVPLAVRVCGAVHSDGVTCTLPVMYEPGCCADIVYEHPIHEAWTDVGNGPLISHRWKEVLVIQDMPYNCYGPIVDDEDGDGDECV